MNAGGRGGSSSAKPAQQSHGLWWCKMRDALLSSNWNGRVHFSMLSIIAIPSPSPGISSLDIRIHDDPPVKISQ